MRPRARRVRCVAAAIAAIAALGVAGCGTPAYMEDVAAINRRAEAQMKALDDVQRLHRIGRFDEAQRLSQQLDSSMREQVRELTSSGSGEAAVMPGRDRILGILESVPTLADIGDMRRELENDERFVDREPLFVRPVLLPTVSGAAAASWRELSAHLDAGELGQALAAAERSRVAAETQDADDPTAAIVALNNLGVVHARLGADTGSLTAYRQAHERLRAVLDRPARSMVPDLAALLAQSRDGKSADDRAEETLARSPDIRDLTAAFLAPRLLSNLGLAYWKRGDTAAALDAFAGALDARAEWDESLEHLSERAQLARAEVAAEELDGILALEHAHGSDRAPSLGIRALLERKGALLERQTLAMTDIRRESEPVAPRGASIGELLGGFLGGTGGMERRARESTEARFRAENRDLLEQYQLALTERADLANRPSGGGDDPAQRAKAIADLDLRLQVMQREIRQRAQQKANERFAPDPGQLASGKGITEYLARIEAEPEARRTERRSQLAGLPMLVRSRLPGDTVLLEMLTYRPRDPAAPSAGEARWLPQRYASYLLRRDRPPAFIDFGEVAVIDRLVAGLRRALASPASLDEARALGRELDLLLTAPVRKAAGAAATVLVAPEGNLNLIPFGALVDEQGRFLLESTSFNYLASGRDLARTDTARAPRAPALVVANPTFGRRAAAEMASAAGSRSLDFSSVDFEPLPGTAAEAAAIKRLLPDAELLTDERATETAVKRAGGPSVLHLATHGFFLDDQQPRSSGGQGLRENPMLRSGLVFAGVAGFRSGDDDGVLTALEAAGLDLVGTQLVVLSACQTGVGDVRNGEGVFGLRRAFVLAGAQTLVMSLWPIDDDTTQRLMAEFYRRLAAGEGRTDALRGAQLALLSDAGVRHPFYWGSFIATGKSAPLR